MKIEFALLIFEKKISNIMFHQNPSRGSRVVPCGRRDGNDEANSRFRNFANAPKNHNKFRYLVQKKKKKNFVWVQNRQLINTL